MRQAAPCILADTRQKTSQHQLQTPWDMIGLTTTGAFPSAAHRRPRNINFGQRGTVTLPHDAPWLLSVYTVILIVESRTEQI
jgi:hypothetical protein